MKTMWSHIGAILLCVCVGLYSGALNAGAPMGSGLTEMVICADGGAKTIERVDLLVQRVAASIGMQNDLLDETVAIVNDRLDANRFEAPFFKVA